MVVSESGFFIVNQIDIKFLKLQIVLTAKMVNSSTLQLICKIVFKNI